MRTISLNVFASATTTNLDSPLISSNNKSLCTVHHIDLPLPFYRCSIRSIKTFRRADTRSRRIPPTATTSNHANGLTRHARWKVPVVTRPRRVLLLEQGPPSTPRKDRGWSSTQGTPTSTRSKKRSHAEIETDRRTRSGRESDDDDSEDDDVQGMFDLCVVGERSNFLLYLVTVTIICVHRVAVQK